MLSVGRDGITLGVRIKRGNLFEVATTGTVSVLDRRGRRLGTVYLAYTPESGQTTMSRELTRLLREVLTALAGSAAASVLRHRRGGQGDDVLRQGAGADEASRAQA